MQLLHTADLHVGKRIHEASMLAEQRAILEQIAQLAIDRAVDGVLLAGDLYDKTIPTEEAVRLLDRFLTTLKNAEIPVFFISGNHDSAERLSFGWKILAQSGVYCSTPFSGTLQTIALEDSFGTVQITLLPFLKPAVVRPHFPDETIETYEDAVRCALSTVALDPSVRHVLLAHQLVTANGTQPERCDSETITVGGLDQVDVSLFDAFDYVALGHLHGAQKIGRETVRYSGSPLKYSFSEHRHHKSVTIVTLEEKGQTSIELVPLTPLHDLRQIEGELECLLSKEVLEQGDAKDYLRVILTDKTMPYDAIGQLRQAYPNVLRIDFAQEQGQTASSDTAADRVEEQTPLELFASFYEMANEETMTDEEIAILKAALQKLEENAP